MPWLPMGRPYPSLPATSRMGVADHGERTTRARAAIGREACAGVTCACGYPLARRGDRLSRPMVRDHGREPFLDEVADARIPAAMPGALDSDGHAVLGSRDRVRSRYS